MVAGRCRLRNAAAALAAALLAACAASPPHLAPAPAPPARGARLQQRPARDPAAVAEVLAGRSRVANAAWWGFDAVDATAALQAAIDSAAPTVLVPDMGSPWYVRPIRLVGDQEIIFEQGVVVEAKGGAFAGGGDSLFSADNLANLTLRGAGTMRMRKADYQQAPYEAAEWRHAVSLESCRNVLIEGLRIESSGGDGIYIGNSRRPGVLPYCEAVTVRDVTLLDHHRQGISVVSVRGLLVEDSVIEGTAGTAPQAGIDFEPNRAVEYLQDCIVRRCSIRGNAGAGIQVYLRNLDDASAPVSLTVESSVLRRNLLQLWITPAGGSPRGTVRLRGNDIGWPQIIRRAGRLAVEVER